MRIAASVLFLSVLWCASAHADDKVDDARKQFVEGVQRFQAGDFEGARAAFGRAEAEHHSPVIVYNLARTEERLGHPQAAIDHYEAYLAEGGDSAEYGPAAALAIAQIKGRSPRVRIETDPQGAQIFVDGTPIAERSPTTLLVTVGHHHVVVEGEGWRGQTDVDAVDTMQIATVSIAHPALPPKVNVPPTLPVKPAAPAVPDDFVYGVHFMLVPYQFGHASGQTNSTAGLAAGGMLDLGYALTERTELFFRAVGAVGSEGNPLTSIGAMGIAFSVRALPSLWIGAGFLGGRATIHEVLQDNNVFYRYDTDYVFSPQIEVSYAVLTTRYGQWLFSALPAFFVGSPRDNTCLYVPIGFGLRGF